MMLVSARALSALSALLVSVGTAQARDEIFIVGSSTVYPFSSAVAEQLGATSAFPTPVVESTGTGGGFERFCEGIGEEYPDIANASRRITDTEFERCERNGVQLVEVKIGYDGIVVANAKDAPSYELTLEQLFLALAAQTPVSPDGQETEINPNQNWSDISETLPAELIEVFGPPATSGTRDAFEDVALEQAAMRFPGLAAMAEADPAAFQRAAHTIREDGAWIDGGENDNAVVQTLAQTPSALGVFGLSFLEQNADLIKGIPIDGVQATPEAIAGGDYPIARSLYFYVKLNHVGDIPGLEEYVTEFTDEAAWGPLGYLKQRGLVPLPDDERAAQRRDALNLKELTSL